MNDSGCNIFGKWDNLNIGKRRIRQFRRNLWVNSLFGNRVNLCVLRCIFLDIAINRLWIFMNHSDLLVN